jgi:tetratricopeptide (TPR) repeat protein
MNRKYFFSSTDMDAYTFDDAVSPKGLAWSNAMPTFHDARSISYWFKITILFLTFHAVVLSAQKTQKNPSSKPIDDSTKQMQLRFRLQANPHDKQAHEELIKILKAKYAFRPEMEEDGAWLRNNPDDFWVEIEMRSLATTAVNDPEYAINIDHFVLAHTNRPDDPKDYDFTNDKLAFALLDRNHNIEALEILKKATIESPDDAGVWENLGDAQTRTDQPSLAIPSYRKSIELDSSQEGPHQGLANALFKLGQYADAETEFAAAISVYNAQFHGSVSTDTFHMMMKKIQEATHNEPVLADLHRQLTRVYVAEQKSDKALIEVDAAAESNPNDKINYEYLRASIYETSGQMEKAKATRLRAHNEIQNELKKEPHNAEMDSMTAYPEIMFMSIEDDEHASAHEIITFLEPLISSGTLKPMDLFSLGLAYCTVGRPADCNSYAESGIRSSGKLNTPTAQHNLAQALLKNRDLRGALGHFQEAYERDPQNLTYRMDYEATKQQLEK